MTILGGYYLKARCIKDKAIAHAPPLIREVWDYLLREANHKDRKYNGFSIKRGQLFRSYKEIREALHWNIGWRKETYSENQMKTAMRYLKKHTMITTTRAPGGVLITIINYDTYQNPANYESTNESTNESTKENTRRTPQRTYNNKNDKKKENKNENNKTASYSEPFQRWWKTYPMRNGRKIGKNAASRMFEKIKKEDWRSLKEATENYFLECNGKPKDAERFLTNDFWKEYLGKPQGDSVSAKNASTEDRMSQEELYAFLRKGIAASNSQEELEDWLRPRCEVCFKIAYNNLQFLYEHGESDFKLFWERYNNQ